MGKQRTTTTWESLVCHNIIDYRLAAAPRLRKLHFGIFIQNANATPADSYYRIYRIGLLKQKHLISYQIVEGEREREREKREKRREEREMLSVSVNSTRKVMKVAAAGASGGRLVTTRATRGGSNRSRSVVEANAEANNSAVNRRSLLLELGTAAAATLAFAYGGEAGGGVAFADEVGDDYFPVSSLPKGAKAQQTAEVQGLVKEAVKKCVTEDYTTVLQLAFPTRSPSTRARRLEER